MHMKGAHAVARNQGKRGPETFDIRVFSYSIAAGHGIVAEALVDVQLGVSLAARRLHTGLPLNLTDIHVVSPR